MKKKLAWLMMTAGSCLLLGVGAHHLSVTKSANAQANSIYGNNADGQPYILVMNPTTYAVTDSFTGLSGSNGRGVVVVGGTAYYTAAGGNNVFSYTIATHHDNGSLFTVAGASGLSTMAYDGTNFWLGDYSGTNQAFLYSPAGTLLKTVHLANCASYCDGLEYFLQNGNTPRLISNEGDPVAPYDIYDTNGTLIQAHFITPPQLSSSGIAFDGTNFLTSDIFNAKIALFNGTTGALISSNAITGAPNGFAPEIEDLSANYTITLNPTTPAAAPALSEFGFLLCAILLMGSGIILNRRKSA